MTDPDGACGEGLAVHLNAANDTARNGVLALLRRTRIALTPRPDPDSDTVIVAVAPTVQHAIEACPEPLLSGGLPLLIAADTFSLAGVRRAVELGVRSMLRSTSATPGQLVAAVQSARHGDGQMPHAVLLALLNGASVAPAPASLTARQTAMLALMAEGHGNAAIARTLSCSEHTVRNAVHGLLVRLRARNRAQAVANAVRTGLI